MRETADQPSAENWTKEDEELIRRIFERREKETRVGQAVPSAALIAKYWDELGEIQDAQAGTEHSDHKLIAA